MYDFDPVGNNPANMILNEVHATAAVNGVDVQYFHVDAAPFYGQSMIVVDADTGDALEPGTDYVFGHEFEEATENIGSPIYGSVCFTDPSRVGTYKFTYRTIGGDYVTPTTTALANGLAALAGLLTVQWEDVINVPAEFPPTPHTHALAPGVEGIDSILEEFALLRQAIADMPNNISFQDISDLDTAFTTPLLTHLNNISTNLANLLTDGEISHVEFNSATSAIDVADPDNATWTDSTISLVLPRDGVYYLDYEVNPVTTWTGAEGEIDLRWVINGEGVTNSARAKKTLFTGVKDNVVKLQFRTTQEADNVSFATATRLATMFALRVGAAA